jgi:hypothetical protein
MKDFRTKDFKMRDFRTKDKRLNLAAAAAKKDNRTDWEHAILHGMKV